MTSEQEQIKVSYETLGMTPEEISVERDLDVVAVKASLMCVSNQYRQAMRVEGKSGVDVEEKKLGFTDEQEERVLERIYNIAVGSENDAVALNACKYVRDDKRGRLDVVGAVRGLNFNVLMFNDALRKAESAVDKALGLKSANHSNQVTNV